MIKKERSKVLSAWNYLATRKRWIFFLVALTSLSAVLNIGVIVAERLAHHLPLEWSFYFINEFTGSYTLILFIPGLVYLFEQYPLKRPQLGLKILGYILVTIIFGVLYTSIMYASRVPFYFLAGINRLTEIFNDLPYRYLMEYFKQFFTFWLVYIAYTALVQYQQNQEHALKASKLNEELLKAQVRVLQMQLHPHFFFNTLNTISSMMYTDPAGADRLIAQLSSFLRKVIDLKNEVIHRLEEEIILLDQFASILKARYPDSLNIHFEIDPKSLHQKVPVLILQPVLENSIQYSIHHQPVTNISLQTVLIENHLNIRLLDNGPGLQEGTFTIGTGLSTTYDRLNKLYGDQHKMDLINRKDAGLEIFIQIPIQ